MRALAGVEIEIFVQNGLQFLRCAIQVVIKRLLFQRVEKTTRRRNCRKVCRVWKRIALYEALLNVRGKCRMYTVRLGHCGTSDLAGDPETGKRHQKQQA